MKVLLIVLFSAGLAIGAPTYVWNLLKSLSATEIQALLSQKFDGQYPSFSEIPKTNFDCSSKEQPGYYADVDAQCQIFHRCDLTGNVTSYICVNSTVFNQITLVCDYYFNVDCAKFKDYENFANSRLYTDKPLFDTPSVDSIAIPAVPVLDEVSSVTIRLPKEQLGMKFIKG